MAAENNRSWFDRVGCLVSGWVSDLAATPAAQIMVILICGAWFVLGLADTILTAILSIMAITLTQMVLNRQNEREADAHRRDVAMHAKLDELLIAMKGARNEMAGIEELDEANIEELKSEVADAIEEAGPKAGDRHERAAAKKAVVEAVQEELSAKAGKRRKPAASAGRR